MKEPEDSEELMTMLQFVENARSAGMVKLNERIRHAMERLTYLLDTFLFEQGKFNTQLTEIIVLRCSGSIKGL